MATPAGRSTRSSASSRLGRLRRGQMSGESLDVLTWRQLDHVDLTPAPELPLERARVGLNRPGAVAQRLVAAQSAEQESQIPVGHRVAEEQEVASLQLCGQTDRNQARHLRLCEIVDVVVLGDDEAFPGPFGCLVDLPVKLEDHGPSLERELRGVGVRKVDQRATAVGTHVAKLASMRAAREVRDDVELLSRLGERAL